VERAFWGPLRLEDGLILAAGYLLDVLGNPVCADLAAH
jgi:hypothetical protein